MCKAVITQHRTTVLVLVLLLLPLHAAASEICEEQAAYLAARAYALALPIQPRDKLERHVKEHALAFENGGVAQRCLKVMSKAVRKAGFSNIPKTYEQRFRANAARQIATRFSREKLELEALLFDEATVARELYWLARASAYGAAGKWHYFDNPGSQARAKLYRQRLELDTNCAKNDLRCRTARQPSENLVILLEERMLMLALGGKILSNQTGGITKEKPVDSNSYNMTFERQEKTATERVFESGPLRPRPTISMPSMPAGVVPDASKQKKTSSTNKSTEPSVAPVIPNFPWPPPAFSSRAEVSRQFFAGQERLGEVADSIVQALERAGHVEWSYYSIPGGFALATRLENLEPDGTPKADRWTSSVGLSREFSIREYLRALFTAPAGYFRIIVLAVTSEPFTPTEASPTRDQAMEWISFGGTGLPHAIADLPFGVDYQCIALIYEFEKLESGAKATTLVPGRYPGRVHLQKSNVWAGLANE